MVNVGNFIYSGYYQTVYDRTRSEVPTNTKITWTSKHVGSRERYTLHGLFLFWIKDGSKLNVKFFPFSEYLYSYDFTPFMLIV